MNAKKYLGLFLVLAMTVSLLTACAGGKKPAGTEVTPQPTESAAVVTDTPKPDGPKKTLKILAWDLGVDGVLPIGNNYWTEWMQSEFGDPNNIDLEWVSMPRWEEVTTLNVWMAGQDAPDIVFTYDINVVINYLTQGGLADLTAPLDTYGKELKSFLGDTVLEYGRFDGKQMVIPALRPLPGIVGSAIRGDWLEKVNMKVRQRQRNGITPCWYSETRIPGRWEN
jgi:putative aldouronate transport system substrate-binding protein